MPAEYGFVSVAAPRADARYEDFSPDLESSPVVSHMGGSMLATRRGDTLPFATDRLKAEFAQVGGDDERSMRRPFPVSVPLLSVLALQTVLALRLMWSKTGFNDEALYLWAGHLELAHILHGTPVPAFQTYFSGAPVIYPPLGALADNLGGLAGPLLCFTSGRSIAIRGHANRVAEGVQRHLLHDARSPKPADIGGPARPTDAVAVSSAHPSLALASGLNSVPRAQMRGSFRQASQRPPDRPSERCIARSGRYGDAD